MNKRFFYSAEGDFTNTTTVYAWESKTARDAYIERVGKPTCYAIRKNKVGINAANWSMTGNCMIEPKPFTGEYWGIVELFQEEKMPAECVGKVEICINMESTSGNKIIQKVWN